MCEINSIDSSVSREYMKERMAELCKRASDIVFENVKEQVFEDNLILIDSLLPSILGEMAETTFYTISVYFGAAKIQKVRHTVAAALIADLAGFFMASVTAKLFF